MAQPQLKGKEKALIFLSTLGDDVSHKVLSCLPDKISAQISQDLSRFKKPTPAAIAFVLKELARFTLNRQPEPLKINAPQSAKPQEPEIEEIDKLSCIGRKPVTEIVTILQDELPQTAAFVLSYLSPALQSRYYELLSPGRRNEVKQCAVEKLPWSNTIFEKFNEQLAVAKG
jgi:flagellar motor switch protein FliG